jgi:hypothetical protein
MAVLRLSNNSHQRPWQCCVVLVLLVRSTTPRYCSSTNIDCTSYFPPSTKSTHTRRLSDTSSRTSILSALYYRWEDALFSSWAYHGMAPTTLGNPRTQSPQLLSDSSLSLNWYFTKPKRRLRHRWFQCTCSRICRGLWPTMVFSLYTSDLIKEGYLCCVAGCGTKTGQIVGRNLCRRLAKQKTQM